MSKNRVEAIINTNNLIDNYKFIKSLLKPSCRILSVIKADAYGHGAIEVAKTLSGLGADNFAVACIEEAEILRNSGINGNIVILGITPLEMVEKVIRYGLYQTVSSVEYAKQLSNIGKIQIHIKIDTGMSRLGLYCHSDEDIDRTACDIEYISKLPNIKIAGIYTHFAESDNVGSGFTEAQFALFEKLLAKCEEKGINTGLRHCCNSEAIFNFPLMHQDMVRAGLCLYGLSNSDSEQKNLKPVMSLCSRIAQISHIKKGDTISYNRMYTADDAMKIAVISIGYADGLMRGLSDGGFIQINGVKAPIIGKICMDLCVCDVSGIQCAVGDDVLIFGENKPVGELAELLGTINYEIICSVKNRVPRRYI